MRDKKDNATFDLPGLEAEPLPPLAPVEAKPASVARLRRTLPRQEQLALLEETDASGLPVWRRDPDTDLTGLPIWAEA